VPSGESGGASAVTQSAAAVRHTGSRGHSGRANIPYSVGWTVGTWAGATHRTVRNAFRSNGQQVDEGEI